MKQPILGLAFALAALLLPATTSADVFGCPPICGLPLSITSDSTSTATVGTPIQIQFTGSPTVSSDSVSFATTSNPSFGTLGTITNDTPTTAIATYIPTSAGTDTIAFDATEFAPADPSTAVNTGSGTIAIIVSAASSTPDTTPPVITPPATQYFATSTFPATLTLTFATATDDSGQTPTISVSTTTFTVGTTTVTWTATDASGNSAATTSLVVLTDTTPAPVSITLSIYTSTSTVFSGPLTVTACPETLGGATTTVNGFCAVDQASQANGFPVTWQWFSFGAALTAVNGEGDWNNGPWYTTFTDGQPLSVALSEHTLTSGESVVVSDGPMPLELSVSTTSPSIGATTTVTVLGFNATNFDYEPVAGATIVGASTSTNASGIVDITATSTDPFTISASATGYIASNSITITATSTASTPVAGSNPSSGGGGGGIAHGLFSVPKALAYLGTVQHADGSFDNDLLTDWAALAFSAQDASGMKAKLTTYLTSAKPSLSNVTDYERHAMALEALGINPYTGTATDVITPIVSNLSSAPCDASHIASNIFAIFPLLHAGYSASDSVIQNSVACIVASQASNGSWNDPDTTAAAIQALSLVNSLPNVTSTITKAQTYLKSQEQSTGSFGSTPSTSWALQAIAALGQTESQWSPSGYYPSDYLATMQQTDGGVELSSKDAFTRAWATEFAIPGVLGKTWHSLLSTFARPSTSGGGSNSSNTTATTTAATTTPVVATSTTAIATSTPSAATTTPIVVPLAQTFTTVTSTPTPTPTAPSPKPVATRPTPTVADATTTATTSPSAQVAAAANAAVGFDWRWLFYLILGFLALCGLSWLAYSLIVKRA